MEIILSNYSPEVAISIQNKSKWSKPNRTSRSIIWIVSWHSKAYDLAQDLRNIFEKTTDKIIDLEDYMAWKVNQSGFKSFNTISRSIMNHYQTILNYFDKGAQTLQLNLSMLK
jgi:hypothetical protein